MSELGRYQTWYKIKLGTKGTWEKIKKQTFSINWFKKPLCGQGQSNDRVTRPAHSGGQPQIFKTSPAEEEKYQHWYVGHHNPSHWLVQISTHPSSAWLISSLANCCKESGSGSKLPLLKMISFLFSNHVSTKMPKPIPTYTQVRPQSSPRQWR